MAHFAYQIPLRIWTGHTQRSVISDTYRAKRCEIRAHLPSMRRTSQSAPSALGVATRQGVVARM